LCIAQNEMYASHLSLTMSTADSPGIFITYYNSTLAFYTCPWHTVSNKRDHRFQRVLTMVYNTQNCWIFRLCPSSGILKTREDNVSKTGPIFVPRWVGDFVSALSQFLLHIFLLFPFDKSWSHVFM
jgi:hypothetical protein